MARFTPPYIRATSLINYVLLLAPLLVAGCTQLRSQEPPAVTSPGSGSVSQASSAPVIAAAGDIACAPEGFAFWNNRDTNTCQMQATADLLNADRLTAVLPLGDLQYNVEKSGGFETAYDATWGKVKAISYPVVGNHEYRSRRAAKYFTYFGTAAGEPDKGYYSYNLGGWHLIALNSNCKSIDGCSKNSPQGKWLKADLAAHPAQCTLAYWHHPRFSSGPHGNHASMADFWQILYDAGAEIVLNGHDHVYERFAPQTPAARPNSERGIRQFVVGTGGKSLYPFAELQSNSEVRNADTYGVLMLTLHSNSYDWKFTPIASQSFTDSGRDNCH